MRLTAVAAAALLPQLPLLPERLARWRRLYDRLARGLMDLDGLRLPRRDKREDFVGSSLQFFVDDSVVDIDRFCAVADELGVHVKWFGSERPAGFTSSYRSWAYARASRLPRTDALLAGLCDLRVPLALDVADCDHVVEILAYALETAKAAQERDANTTK